VQVDNSPAAGLQTHWVVLYKKQGDDYLMLDPWPHPSESGQNVPMMPRYSQGRALKRAITAVVMYECLTSGGGAIPGTPPVSEPAPEPAPVPTGVFIQVVADAPAGLRLRSAPTTESATLTIEPPLSLFEIIETGAEGRVGRVNEWIRVRDTQGLEGYVAAWYVERVPAPAPVPGGGETPTPPARPAPQPQPAPPSTPPPVTGPGSQELTLAVSSSVGASGLRLRKAASMAGALVAVEKAGTRLSVLEPTASARLKIGTAQWIHVRDPKGRRGYVSGLYVSLA
jgi:hypothetical protein